MRILICKYTCKNAKMSLYSNKVKALVAQLCLTLCNPMVSHQAPLSLGFPRQKYWSGLPFPPPGDNPNPKDQPGSPTLQADSLLPEPTGCSISLFNLVSFVQ